MSFRLLPLPALALLAPLTLSQTGPQPRAGIPALAPFHASGSATDDGTLALTLDPDAREVLAHLHVRGEAFTLERWPLLGGLETRAHLRPVSAFEPGARARIVAADGSVTWLAPSVLCFSGSLEEGGELFFGLTETELHGYFRLGGELHFLSSGGSPAGAAWLARGSALPRGDGPPTFCAAPSRPRALEPDGGAERELVATPHLATANVFIEADNVYRALFPSNQACLDYSALLIAATSEIYRRDVGVRLVIPNGYLRVWNTTPPWGVITTFGNIGDVRGWWTSLANPDRSLPRAAVHVLTTPVFGGVANSIGGVCVNVNGYEISSVFGHFPSPRVHTHSDNWDLFVVAHEFGHSFGCQHSFDFQPPIQCQDGSGPDQGTIMSYCHQSFGVGGVGMRFHVREQREILEYLTFVSCLADQPLALGDYDADGAVDNDDLAVMNATLAQGFRSLGAENVLDFDGDGGLDAVDRDLLASAIGTPPASVTFRNGRGLNNDFLGVLGKPVLGRPWTLTLTALGEPSLLFFYDLPHPGLRTPYGELLVLPPGLGGRQLYSAAHAGGEIVTFYTLNLPANISLVGRRSTAQGLILGPPATALSNALDNVFSTYE